jgi:uncharacterized protein YbjT (DUF2867 family)
LQLKLLLAGATGLVGRLLLQRLEKLDLVQSINIVGRTKIEGTGQKVAQHMAPTAEWPSLVGQLSPDVAICTLGTTMRQAGSEDAFFAVDHDMVVAFARASSAAGARRFMMVSSVGAHAASRNFYLATKGKAEVAAQAAGFDRVDVFRPGLLRGNRGGQRRIGERLGIIVSPVTDFLTPFVLDHYRSIAADDVAASIAAFLGQDVPGTFVHENRAMWQSIAAR